MNAQNLFKDVQMLTLSGDTADTNINNDESVVVYIDDDEISHNGSSEDETHPMNVKVECSSENDEDSNQSMVVEPDDQVVVNEVSVKGEENSDNEDYSINEICLKYELSDTDVSQNIQNAEEQFELIEESNENRQTNEGTVKESSETEKSGEEVEKTIDETPKESEEKHSENKVSVTTNEKEEESPGSSHDQSLESNEHDHCYSQSNYFTSTNFCESFVNTILTKHKSNPVEMLTAFTNELSKYDSAESASSSSMSQFLQNIQQTLQIKCDSLVGNEVMQSDIEENVEARFEEIPDNQDNKEDSSSVTPTEASINATDNQNTHELTKVPSTELFTGNSFWDDEMFKPDFTDIIGNLDSQPKKDSQKDTAEEDIAMNDSIEIVKEEPLEQEVIITAENDQPESPVKSQNNADKLKSHIENASGLTKIMNESFCDLEELVYENEEDISNGKNKLLKSLKNIVKKSCKLIMEIEDVEENNVVKLEDFIENSLLNFSNMYFNSPKKADNKAEKTDEDSDSEDNEEGETDDDEINKLCNLNTLKFSKNYRAEKAEVVGEKSENAAVKKLKKKKEELKPFSDESDMMVSSDSEIEDENSKRLSKSDDEAANSSDEERKMVEKHENKCKNLLLVSSDEDSDESTYATSESSFAVRSSDEERKKKKKKRESAKKFEDEDEEVKSEKSESESEKEKSSKKIQSKPKVSSIVYDSDDESESTTKEVSKRAKKNSVDSLTREIFKNDFLDLTEGYKEEKPRIKISSSPIKTSSQSSTKTTLQETKAEPQSEAIDLSQFTSRPSEIKSVDLDKYIEKKITTEKLSQAKPPTPAVDDDECYIISSDSDSEISSNVTEGKTRRRKELSPEELKEETKKAQKAEKDRIKKLDKKRETLTEFLTQRMSQSEDDVICSNDLTLDYSKKKKKTIEVNSKLVDQLKDHQKEGIKFMYDNCYGSVDEVKETNGSGCILAHCMGLGKTLQLITLIHTVIRYPELCTNRILVICPKSTIYNWFEEFKRWLSDIHSRGMTVSFLEDNMKIQDKIKKLELWFESTKPSVFLINYEAFRILVNWSGSHKRAKVTIPDQDVKTYQSKIRKYLLEPGPQLVVCDEGHLIKNQKGATNVAITKIATKRRIILTGTPIQNNLGEYYAMVHWIKPCYLGDIKEFNNLYANPIKEGQLKDSSSWQIKKMKQKCFVLNKMLDKFVQRKEASVLRDFLPEKYEYCLFVPLTEVQSKLYKEFLRQNPFEQTGKHLLPDYTALRKIWTHPQVLQYAYERARRGENKFVNEQQQKAKNRSKNLIIEEDEEDNPDDVYDTSQGTTSVTQNWWSEIASPDALKSLESSHKLQILFELLKQFQQMGEKCLVFTAFVAVLDVIEQFMKAIDEQDNNPQAMIHGLAEYKTTWKLGKDYFRLDGSTPREYRHQMITTFNKPGNQRLRCFLISAKAGGQGINLIGANRCILIDTSWNPAADSQNIFRIYRLGQPNPCFVYRLVALGTMEEKIYSRSVTKQAMSGRVVDRQIIDRHYLATDLLDLYKFTEYTDEERVTPIMPKDDVLKFLLKNHSSQIFKYHEHDSLLENKPEQDLSEAEKKEAWDLYEKESQANRMNPNMNNLYAQMANANMDLAGYTGVGDMFPNLNMYGGMQSPYASLNLLAGSTSAGSGLDLNALSKSYYPSFSSGLYTPSSTEMFKKALQAISDPLSSLYGSSSSSLSSSAQSLTNPSFMSSLLRNQLVPPPAPLTNQSPPSTIVSNYNQNTIPLSSTSIFSSSKPSLLSPTTTSSSSSTGGPSTSIAAIQKTHMPQVLAQRSLLNNSKGAKRNSDSNESIPAKKYAMMVNASKNPVVVPKNSSSNLTILPDNDMRQVSNGNRNGVVRIVGSNNQVQQLKRVNPQQNLSNTIGNQLTSARTNSPYIRKTPSQLDISKKTALEAATAITAPTTPISSPKTLTKQVTGAFQSATNSPQGRDNFANRWVKPIAKQPPTFDRSLKPSANVIQPSRLANNQKNRTSAAQQIRLNTSNQQQQQVNKQILNLPKNTSVSPAANKSVVIAGQKRSVDPIPHIQKQLEKHQTSMTDSTGVKNLQIPSGSANSVSIIKLPTNQITPIIPKTSTTNSGGPQASIAITPIARSSFNPNAKKVGDQIQANGPKIRGTIAGNKIVISPQQVKIYEQDQQQQKINRQEQQKTNVAPTVLVKKPSNNMNPVSLAKRIRINPPLQNNIRSPNTSTAASPRVHPAYQQQQQKNQLKNRNAFDELFQEWQQPNN